MRDSAMRTNKEEAGKTIKVKWIRSAIGRPERQKKIIKGLGFKRLNQTLTLPDRAEIRGMIDRVWHLVKMIEKV